MTPVLMVLIIIIVGIASQIKTSEAAFAVTMLLAVAVLQLVIVLPGRESVPQSGEGMVLSWNEGEKSR